MNPQDPKPLQETVPPPDTVGLNAPTAAPTSESAAEATPSDDFRPQIEGYEIIERIGAGGMGTVWRAVQISTRREVALKLVSAAIFGSERGRLRFDREVELMARLEHPNIARVYDSGTDRGVYFYAMELVKGVPLDQYVAEQKLSQRQIIELMRSVCQAVMFAHQHGVIHRDLKPSNILVTPDGQPHVLDFGLAKGLFDSQAGPAVTIDGEVAGTPAFMSPEQAVGLPVDTRSDVYSLGVILYRLLTGGQSPHDLSGSHLQVLQRISNDEIRRPRDADREINRELEAILLKALRKNPNERYASAGEFAQDLDNYLRGEPLIARAPTTIYFLRKRIRKHRFPVAVASIILAAIVGIAIYAYARVARERSRALAAQQFLTNMLTSADPGTGNRADIRVRDVLDKASTQIDPLQNQPEVEAVVRTAIGHTYTVLGLYPQAEAHLRKAIDLNKRLDGAEAKTTLANQKDLGAVLMYTARYKEAEPVMLDTYQRRLKTLGENNKETADSIFNLALLYMQMHRYDECLKYANRALAIRERLFGPDSAEVASSLQYIAETYTDTQRFKEAEPLYRRSLEIREKTLGPNHMEIGNSLNNWARMYLNSGQTDKAEPLLVRALEIFKTALPSDHPNNAYVLDNLAAIKIRHNDFDGAAPLAERSLKIKQRMYPPEHPELARSVGLQALIEGNRGNLALAEKLFREALTSVEKSLGPNDLNTIWLVSALGGTLKDEQKYAEALPYLRRAKEAYAKPYPDQAELLQLQIMDALIKLRQFAEAEPIVIEAYQAKKKVTFPDAATRFAELGPVVDLMANLYDGMGQSEKAKQFRDEHHKLQAATQPTTKPSMQ